jgi:exo-beta-1,3-glucanase (GH17 family)
LQAAGFNAIRTYRPIVDPNVLDVFQSAGIYVVNSVYSWGGAEVSSAVEVVNAVKDHPAILMWTVGNEWNYNNLYQEGSSYEQARARVNEVAAAIKAADPDHPVATIYGDPSGLSAETIASMSAIDLWGLNVYRGGSFGGVFSTWRALSDKPVFIGEYGADAYHTNVGVDEATQAAVARNLTSEILSQADHGVVGGTIFAWCDEWDKRREGSPDVQETDALAIGAIPPDNRYNEEWWGIVDIDRNPRAAYYALGELFTE